MIDQAAMKLARKFAEEVWLAKLTSRPNVTDAVRNETIKRNVAAIRAGNADEAVSVQAAYLALTDRRGTNRE